MTDGKKSEMSEILSKKKKKGNPLKVKNLFLWKFCKNQTLFSSEVYSEASETALVVLV